MMPYIWIGVLLLALVTEALTADFVAIWFFPAALVSMILAFCGVPLPWQIFAFFLVGLVLALTTRRLCLRFLQRGEVPTNVDELIGKTALVTEEISNILEKGEVKLQGLCWSARAKDPREVIAVGTEVTVEAVQGVKLIVTLKNN